MLAPSIDVDLSNRPACDGAMAEAQRLAEQLLAAGASDVDAGLNRMLHALLRMTGARCVEFTLLDLKHEGAPLCICSATAGMTLAEPPRAAQGGPLDFEFPIRAGRLMRLSLSFAAGATPGLKPPELGRWVALWHRWLYWLDLSHGPVDARGPVPRHHRKVLLGLLNGLAEKQISAELGQSIHTTHQYVKLLYRRYGVRNRGSLMALWLAPIQRPAVGLTEQKEAP